MSEIVEGQTGPVVEATKPAAEAKDAIGLAELAELRAYKAEQERIRGEAEKAKLSEAEQIKRERQELASERFLLRLQQAGVPEHFAKRFSAPEKGSEKIVDEIAKDYAKLVAEAKKAAAAELATQQKPDIGAPAGPAGIDQKPPDKRPAGLPSLMDRPSAAARK